VLNIIVSYEYQKMNMFGSETCLNVKHQRFICQHIVQIYSNTYWHAIQTVWVTQLLRSLHQSSKNKHRPGHSFRQQRFLIHKQTYYTKHELLVLWNTYHQIVHPIDNGRATAETGEFWTTLKLHCAMCISGIAVVSSIAIP